MLDKRQTTLPEYLQGEQATEAGQEEAGDLDTEPTFLRDILETDESEDGTSIPEEELELKEEPEEKSVKSINLENDDGDSKENDDGDSKENDDGDSKENDDGDSKENDDGDSKENDDGDSKENDDGED